MLQLPDSRHSYHSSIYVNPILGWYSKMLEAPKHHPDIHMPSQPSKPARTHMFAAFLAAPTLCSSAATCRRPSVSKTHGVLEPSIWTNDVKVNAIFCPATRLAVKSNSGGILPILHRDLRNAALGHLQLFSIHEIHGMPCCGPYCIDGLDQLKLRQSIGGHIVAVQNLQQLPLPKIRQLSVLCVAMCLPGQEQPPGGFSWATPSSEDVILPK